MRPEKAPSSTRRELARRAFFAATGRLTSVAPRLGSRFIDAACAPCIGNPILAAYGRARIRRIMSGVRSFRRFLVVPDIHIGDAVMTQAAVSALRDFFPESTIDYVVNRTAYPLIAGNPEATRVLPLFSGGDFVSCDDLSRLRELVRAGGYDAVWSFNPFLKNRDFAPDGQSVLHIINRAPDILRREKDPARINHFIHHIDGFVRELLAPLAPDGRRPRFRGVRLTLPSSAGLEAIRFLAEAGLPGGRPLVLFNPDGASLFTRIPYPDQASLLARLAELDATILLNAGHTAAGLGRRLQASLPPGPRARTMVLPVTLPIEVYAGVVDRCDAFLSGDSGPLHIAAARRESSDAGFAFRNRTAVLACFGATPARMSGYDSAQPGFLPANQDAPSWTIKAESPCRNLSCLNKMQKTCRPIRCFENLDSDGIVDRIKSHLAEAGRRSTARSMP